ncbi:MAG: SurA N-terminal domain-containing protein [Pseudomonadota bacterium]
MLQNIREKFTGTFALVVLVLLAIPFVFVGVGANYSFFGGSSAAEVDGEEINLGLFEARYRDFVENNPSLATASDAQRQQVRRSILDNLVYEQLIENYLNEHGYRIGDEQVIEAIRSIPDFQTDGQFDREAYNAVLQANRLNNADFELSQRGGLRRQQLQLAIAATAFVTPAEYRRYINLIAEQRLVTTATFSPELLAGDIEIGDEAVAGYYEENPTLFQTPESADVEYVMISRDDVAADIEVSEEELAIYYEENKYRYLQDEQREARHILITFGDDEVAAEATARDLLARINAGESFAELASEFSEDPGTAAQGGSFGALPRSQFPPELGAAVFAIGEGEVDGPIRTDFGYHLVKLDGVLTQGAMPLEQVRAELTNEIRERDVDAAFRALENELGNALFDSSDIQVAAEAIGAEVLTAAGITRSGGEPFGQNQVAIDTIFSEAVLSGGATSELVELDNDRAVVLRVSEYNEASRQALDEVREQIRGILTAAETERRLRARAEELLAGVEAGAEFRSAADAAGAEVSEPLLLSRQEQTVDSTILYSVFAAGRPSEMQPIRQIVRNSAGGYTVYSLDAVLPGRPQSIPLAERDSGKLFRAQEAGFADFSAFLLELREDADVVINEDALAATDFLQ